MVEEYFGFSSAPFKLSPDSKFFFGSTSHTKAMAYLHYGIRQAEGFIIITGEIGAGKSTLIEHMLDQLNRSNVSAAHLLTSNLQSEDLLTHVLSSFQIEPEGSGRAAELEAFEDFLYENVNRGKRVLLVVDEVQNLPIETLEELRMLTNINHQGAPLFQVFLVGQPEFRDTLARPDLEQLRQRVIASYHLEALDHDETREYIEHRLAIVGRVEEPYFTEEAFAEIYSYTQGIPRRINTLCTRILLFCALEKRNLIERAVVRAVANELNDEMALPVHQSMTPPPLIEQEDMVPPDEFLSHDEVGQSDTSTSLNDVREAMAALVEDPQFNQDTQEEIVEKAPTTQDVVLMSEQNNSTPAVSEQPASVFDQLNHLRGNLHEAKSGTRNIHRVLCDMEERQNSNVIKMEAHLEKATALLKKID